MRKALLPHLLARLFVLVGCACAAPACTSNLNVDSRGCIEDEECASDETCTNGTCTPALVDGDAGCSARVTVSNLGAAQSALVVDVDVPPLAKLAADGRNLRFTLGQGGPVVPAVIGRVDAEGARAVVRIAPLPVGTTELIASACDDVDARVDASAVFDFVATSATADAAKWTTSCTSFEDELSETCELHAPVGADTTLAVDVRASCGSSPFNGVQSFASMPLPIDAGTYVLEAKLAYRAALPFENVGDAITVARATLRLTGTAEPLLVNVDEEDILPGADRVRAPSTVSEAFTLDGSATAGLELQTSIGDCASLALSFSELHIRKTMSPLPGVVVDLL